MRKEIVLVELPDNKRVVLTVEAGVTIRKIAEDQKLIPGTAWDIGEECPEGLHRIRKFFLNTKEILYSQLGSTTVKEGDYIHVVPTRLAVDDCLTVDVIENDLPESSLYGPGTYRNWFTSLRE